MTVTAWIRLDELPERGTIVGFQSKSRNNRDGWTLGHNQQSFVFGLTAGEAQSSVSPVTYLVAKTPLEKERWYYLAATYDGQHMRLFVNGELEAESSAQSGDIRYPENGSFLIGGTASRAHDLFEGGLYELKAYARDLSADEIRGVAKKNENLIAWAPTPETDLMFLVKPYLQFATADSITVMCETSRPAKMRVEYAELRPLDQKAETPACTTDQRGNANRFEARRPATFIA